MDAVALRALQAPLKARYRDDPRSAFLTLKAEGLLGDDSITCALDTPQGMMVAGLHEAAGGDGLSVCSGNLLLEALVGCAGVTLKAVSTALNVPIDRGRITAEGDLDFRGTLGLSKDVPVGYSAIRLRFELKTAASAESVANLIRLTERYCVVYQTLKQSPTIALTVDHEPSAEGA